MNIFIDAACTCFYMKNMALRQVVKKIVGHVDTVDPGLWDMKQVYTRTKLNSKYVTI